VTQPPDHPVGDDLAGQLVGLFISLTKVAQGELRLARAEVAQGIRGMVMALVLLLTALVLGLVLLQTLATAAVAALIAAGLGPIWSPLAVALGLVIVIAVLVVAARAKLKPGNLVPRRSLSRLRQDLQTLKAMVTPDARDQTQPPHDPQPGSDRSAT